MQDRTEHSHEIHGDICGGAYRGRVWRPSDDRTYIGKMRLNGDSVRLRGCVAGGLLCSGQTWQRVNRASDPAANRSGGKTVSGRPVQKITDHPQPG